MYRGFPSKLHHAVPPWVEDGALFHIRIALDRAKDQQSLTTPRLADSLMESARFYHRLRDDERGEQLSAKINYIRQNPVAAGLCVNPQDWPWWIERSALDAEVPAQPGTG